MRALRKVDFLALDEIGLTVSTEKEQARLFELIDSRYSRRRPTLIAMNATAATLASIGERTVDRLREACVAVSIPGDGYRGRAPSDKVLLAASWPISQPSGDALRYIASVDG
jgi:DNA replication protein DnaC